MITLAKEISTVMARFVFSTFDVPKSARAALDGVDTMRLTLSSIRQLITDPSEVPKERKEMIYVRHIVVLFRQADLSLSKLENIICPTSAGIREKTWDKVKWRLEEKCITAAVQRLESDRSSLSIILDIVQW